MYTVNNAPGTEKGARKADIVAKSLQAFTAPEGQADAE
jgi:hypothetical protein